MFQQNTVVHYAAKELKLMFTDHYSWRTAPLTYKVAFYIFIQQI